MFKLSCQVLVSKVTREVTDQEAASMIYVHQFMTTARHLTLLETKERCWRQLSYHFNEKFEQIQAKALKFLGERDESDIHSQEINDLTREKQERKLLDCSSSLAYTPDHTIHQLSKELFPHSKNKI